jgi:hypothetical protein
MSFRRHVAIGAFRELFRASPSNIVEGMIEGSKNEKQRDHALRRVLPEPGRIRRQACCRFAWPRPRGVHASLCTTPDGSTYPVLNGLD